MLRLACLLSVLLVLGPDFALADSAADLASKARKARKNGDFAKAYLLYSQAAALGGSDPKYWAQAQALRRQAILQPNSPIALPTAGGVADVSGTESEADLDAAGGALTDADVQEARKPQPPRELDATPGLKSFSFKEKNKALFEKVARTYGLDVVFDGDYVEGPVIRFQLEGVDYRTALHALEAATGSFIVPIGNRLMLVVKDTPQKRVEVEPNAAVTLAVPNTVAIQEAQELVRGVQQAFDIRRMILDSARRLVFIRDRMSKVYPAEKLLERLIVYSGQVHVEVEFISFNKRATASYGLSLQTLFPLVNFWNSPPDLTSGFTKFITFGGGKTFFGIGVADSQVFARMTKSTGSSILSAEVLSVEGKPATIHIGDKYPVITASYSGGDTSDVKAYTIAPNVSFEDLGVVVKVTPFLHGADGVTLEVEAEYKVLTGAVTNGIPVIATRKFQSRLRLKQGQWGVMAGLVNNTQSRTFSGLYGVSTLPLIGPFLRENTRSDDAGEVLMVIKPHLIGHPPEDLGAAPVWVGSETRPLTQL